ncbi:MAG: tRNA glutamyl-Q(34) synthetase GluQRS [Thiobacillaceae bacterium]
MAGLETNPPSHPAQDRQQLKTVKYVGRFAPSPTGPLHFGSLIAAVGSYLDAHSQGGQWLVRIEDVDEPRCKQTHADDILRTLDTYGFQWDGEVVYQRHREQFYQHALQQLVDAGHAYPCACTRREIADSSVSGLEGPVYPGTCRSGLNGRAARAWRVRVNDAPICFDDRIQGHHCQHLETDVGDFLVKRADGFFAYQLAAVVDDAEQGVTHIVRGADLLASTPRQIHLQYLLVYTIPDYLHLPVVLNETGQKLCKQTLAPPLDRKHCAETLFQALGFLGLAPPVELRHESASIILGWGMDNWRNNMVAGLRRV